MITNKKLQKYYRHALAAAVDSPDPSTKVGAVLINKRSGAVLADGYNGFIRGAPDSSLPTTRPEKYDYIIHAETNLICNAVKHGISTDGCVLFCTMSPCIKCMRMLFQAGIKELYVKDFYSDFKECSSMLDLTLKVSPLLDFYKIEINPKRNQNDPT